MTSIVAIYWKHLDGYTETPLLSMCVTSWSRQGFDVALMGEPTAEKSRFCPKLRENQALMHGQLAAKKPMMLACYERWAALHAIGGGFMIDHDMINYGFSPDDLKEALEVAPADKLACFSRPGFSCDENSHIRPPTPVFAPMAPLEEFLERMVSYEYDTADEDWWRRRQPNYFQINTQVDEEILLSERWPDLCHNVDLVPLYGTPGWREAPIVHFANLPVAGQYSTQRAEFIERVRRP